ncbi:MAG: hypothetical protein JHC26_11810 [Thermofilum sp.]|jgi:hypothetical protein|uniref:hypothetical protein n=1 Tax=Thermofilum sp. TaxID=1961369 RepID=UPI00258AF6F7|nr:hypothetical protein [Thermofilum sp.]MCI4409769.1 hypothetical protein [Thermofilum sp.]
MVETNGENVRVVGILNLSEEIERSLHYKVHVPFIGDFDLGEEEKTALFLILNRDFPDFLKRIDEKVNQLGSEMLQQGYSASELVADITFEVLPSIAPENLGFFYVSIAVRVCPKQFPDFCRADRISLGEREYISRSFDASRNKAGKALRDALAFHVALSLAHQLQDLEPKYEECSNVIDKVSNSCPEVLKEVEGDNE